MINDKSMIHGRLAVLLLITLGMLGVLFVLQANAADTQRVGDFSASTATVSKTEAQLGEVLTYTLVARNNSGVFAPYVYAGQLLTTGQTFASAEVVSLTNATQIGFISNSNGITWTGSISQSGIVTLSLRVTVTADFDGALINNTFRVASGFSVVSRATSVRIGGRGLAMFTVIMNSPSAPTLNAITDGSDGTYNVTWTNNDSVTGTTFILEESTSSTFATATPIFTGTATTHQVTGKNGGTYYYRVKAVLNGLRSGYSNIQSVKVSTFEPDATTLSVGNCTTLRWDFTNIKSVTVKLGLGYDFVSTTGQNSATVCPAVTTTYQLKVTNQDDTVVTHEATITVSGSGCGSSNQADPYITRFDSDKYTINGGETIKLNWDAQCASTIQLLIDHDNNGTIDETHNVQGVEERSTIPPRTTRYILRVNRANSTGSTTFVEASFVVVRN